MLNLKGTGNGIIYFPFNQDLSRHFEAHDLEFNIEDFDFMLDPILKRLRQILKASQPSPGAIREPQQPHQVSPAAADCGGNSMLSGNSIPYELLGSTPLPSPPRSVPPTQADAGVRSRPSATAARPSPTSRQGQQQQQLQLLTINTTPASSLPGESGFSDSGDTSRVSQEFVFYALVFALFLFWVVPSSLFSIVEVAVLRIQNYCSDMDLTCQVISVPEPTFKFMVTF